MMEQEASRSKGSGVQKSLGTAAIQAPRAYGVRAHISLHDLHTGGSRGQHLSRPLFFFQLHFPTARVGVGVGATGQTCTTRPAVRNSKLTTTLLKRSNSIRC